MSNQNFQIGIGQSEDGKTYAIQIIVEPLESREDAEQVAKFITDWLTEQGETGWAQRIQ